MSTNADETFEFTIDSDLVSLLEKLSFEANPAVQTDTLDTSKSSNISTKVNALCEDVKEQLNIPSNDDIDSATHEKSMEIKSNKTNEADPQDKFNSSELATKIDAICEDIKEQLYIPLDDFSESATLEKCTETKSNKINEADFQDETNVKSHTISTNKEEAEKDSFSKSLKSSTPLNHKGSHGKTTADNKSQSLEEILDTGDESVILRERHPERHIRHKNAQPFQEYYIPQRHLKTDLPLPSNLNNIRPSSTSMQNESTVNSTYEFPDSCITNSNSFNNDFPISPSSETLYSPAPSIPILSEEVLDSVFPSLGDVQSLQNSVSSFSNISSTTSTLRTAVQEDSFAQIKLLTTEEVEDVLKDLPESTPSNFSTPFNKELYELNYIPLLPSEEVESVLNTLPNSSDDLNITGNPQNHQANIYYGKGFENTTVPVYDEQDSSIIINPDEENITFDDFNNLYITDETFTSFLNIDDTSTSSSFPTEAAISSLSKSTEYEQISLEIDYKIQQYLGNKFEKEDILAQTPELPESNCGLSCLQLSHNSLPLTSQSRELSQVHCLKLLHPNQVHKSVTQKSEFCKISCKLGTISKTRLERSSSFSNEKRLFEIKQILLDIQNKEYGTEETKVIHYLKVDRKKKYKRTNLHDAVIAGNIEKAFCIVEIHKRWHSTRVEINLWDSNKKTALDLAKESGMDLLVDYLRENFGTEAVSLNSLSHINSTGA